MPEKSDVIVGDGGYRFHPMNIFAHLRAMLAVMLRQVGPTGALIAVIGLLLTGSAAYVAVAQYHKYATDSTTSKELGQTSETNQKSNTQTTSSGSTSSGTNQSSSSGGQRAGNGSASSSSSGSSGSSSSSSSAGGSSSSGSSGSSGTTGSSGSSGGFQANCISSPHLCGYPDATNTGVPSGVSLTNSGSVTVTTDGAVVQNLNITDGQIIIRANNVTIKNTRITTCTYYPIDYPDSSYTGLVVQDTEIYSTCPSTTAGLSFANFTALRVNIHGSTDGIKANSNVIIKDSYIHDLAPSSGSHNDGVQSTGGSNVTFQHNTCDTSDIGDCIQFGSSDTGWTVTNNLVHSTGWAFNGNDGTKNSSFTNNRFARVSGWYGPASLPGSGITWSGNYYDDTGAAINL